MNYKDALISLVHAGADKFIVNDVVCHSVRSAEHEIECAGDSLVQVFNGVHYMGEFITNTFLNPEDNIVAVRKLSDILA